MQQPYLNATDSPESTVLLVDAPLGKVDDLTLAEASICLQGYREGKHGVMPPGFVKEEPEIRFRDVAELLICFLGRLDRQGLISALYDDLPGPFIHHRYIFIKIGRTDVERDFVLVAAAVWGRGHDGLRCLTVAGRCLLPTAL